ncbi:hypothetical protein BGW42_005859 [Actinomortierella wolfii]|nr:hypothetical protein BGW42_005859 [Actinomortierella wolfii]
MTTPPLSSLPSPKSPPPRSASEKALQLPEILENIAQWTEPADAIQCIRTCRTWHPHFLAVVWRSLALYRHDILEAPDDSIVATHGPLVQDLALYFYPREAPEVLARLQRFATYMMRLEELKFRIVGGTDSYFALARLWLVSNRKTLRRFCWSTTRDARKPTRILDAVQYFPTASVGYNLSKIKSQGGDDEKQNEDEQSGGMERLQFLTLEGWDLTIANLYHLLQACPRLSSLSLHRNHFLDRDQQDEDQIDTNEQHPQLLGDTTSWSSNNSSSVLHLPSVSLQQQYQYQHTEVRELQTEGEVPPTLFGSFPNLEKWTAREFEEVDIQRLAQRIQGSNMCSTLACLDLQRAFSPDMMQDEEEEGEEEEESSDINIEEAEENIHPIEGHQGNGSNGGGENSVNNQLANTNNFQLTNVAPPMAEVGGGVDIAYRIDLVPVLRAIHKDTLKILRLSRCVLSWAGIKALCEQHGRSLEHISLDYIRKPKRRRQQQQQQQQQQQLHDNSNVSLLSSVIPAMQNVVVGSNNQNHGNVGVILTEGDNEQVQGVNDSDFYLNIILESCPNLQTFRVRQYHRSYGSVRLWTRSTTTTSSSPSPSSSSSPSPSTSNSASPSSTNARAYSGRRYQRYPTPAWVCKGLYELDIRVDGWVSDHDAIDWLLRDVTGAMDTFLTGNNTSYDSRDGPSPRKRRIIMPMDNAIASEGTPLPDFHKGCWLDGDDLIDPAALVKARLMSLPCLVRVNLGTGWYTFAK